MMPSTAPRTAVPVVKSNPSIGIAPPYVCAFLFAKATTVEEADICRPSLVGLSLSSGFKRPGKAVVVVGVAAAVSAFTLSRFANSV